MGSEVHYRRNVFLDSQTNTLGSGTNCRFIFQPNSFSLSAGEQMRLVMRSFDMRRTWYDLNPTNNTFYWWGPTAAPLTAYTPATPNGYFIPITIAPGTYSNFTDLAAALGAAMTAAGFVFTTPVAYSSITRDFTFTLANSGPPYTYPNGYFVSFYDDSEVPPPNVTLLGFTNDSGEICGGFQSSTLNNLVSLFVRGTNTLPTGAGAYNSPFPAQLSSLEALYIRCSLGTSNFASSGFEPQVPNSSTGLNVTQLWARVELPTSVYDPLLPFITYIEPSDGNYPLYLQQKQLDQMVLQLTDDKGRDLSLLQAYPGQAQSGALSYKMVASWEVLTEIPALSRPISLANIQQNPPFCRP